MNEKQIVTSILLGSFMIALGLIPGALSRLRNGIQNFSAELHGLPIDNQPQEDTLPGQIWIAIAGFALAMLGVAALLT